MIVELDDLTVSYRPGWTRHACLAVDHVTFDIREGDFFALLGPNGAGKSTTFYCILGLMRPASGEARVFGRTLTAGCRAYRDIAYLPEEPHYHEYLTVEEAVTYYAGLSGNKPSRAQVIDALERLDLAKARSTRVKACSKGMKQKVGIARCLLHHPRLLLLDEPMRGLDPAAVKAFRDVLVDWHREGVTVVMNPHMLSEVELVATRVAVMADGRLIAVDDLDAFVRVDADGRRWSLEDSYLALLVKGAPARA